MIICYSQSLIVGRIQGHHCHKTSNTILKAAPVDWNQAYDVQVDFGADERDYIMNAHEHLRRRSLQAQQVTNTSVVASTSSTAAASSASTLSTSIVVFSPNTDSVATRQQARTIFTNPSAQHHTVLGPTDVLYDTWYRKHRGSTHRRVDLRGRARHERNLQCLLRGSCAQQFHTTSSHPRQ